MIHAKLVKNWQGKSAKFLNIDDPKLNLNVYIRYKSAIFDKKIRTPEEKKMMTLKRTQPTTNASRYLIIISPTSYKNNVLYYFSIYNTGFVTMLRKKK